MDVANRLRPYVAQLLHGEDPELVGLSLEELADRVAELSGERMPELRDRAAQIYDFRGIEPNFGHEAAALLLREGLIQLVSVNWDCGVERAGLRAEVQIEGVANATDCIQLVKRLPLYKVHGCATKPNSLALTREEVDRPQTWAVAQVQAALTGGIVVFVGLGTVGLYVREPVEELRDVWTEGATVRVVDPVISEAWREALGDAVEEAHLQMGADEFLDELLRAIIENALGLVEQAVQVLAEHESWAEAMLSGFNELRMGFLTVSADSTIRWWRDGVITTEAGKPFVTELSGRRALMTVSLLAGRDGGPIEVRGVRGRLTVGSASRYFEVVSLPGKHFTEVEVVVRNRIARRLEEDVYHDNRSVVVVVSDATGVFPAVDAPSDVGAGEQSQADVAAGIEATKVTLVAAEDGVLGRLAG